jgi:hypothetical protein
MTQKSVYQWRPRTSFPVDVQKAGEELDKLRGHNSGDLTPEAVVEAARSAESALHGAFEWDDSKAAQQHRLQQATQLIRAVIVIAAGDGKPQEVKVSVVDTPTGGGTSTARVIPPEELHRQRVDKGWKELSEWHKQYGALSEFAAVGAMIGGLIAARIKERAAS